MSAKVSPGMMKYCVVGNIVKEHTDENGIVRYGTAAFPGGRKVYISRRFWWDSVVVLGMNRFKKYVLESVPLELVENVRFTRTFQPYLIELMTNNLEWNDLWWGYKKEDEIGARDYAEMINEFKSGDTGKAEKYMHDVMTDYGWKPR